MFLISIEIHTARLRNMFHCSCHGVWRCVASNQSEALPMFGEAVRLFVLKKSFFRGEKTLNNGAKYMYFGASWIGINEANYFHAKMTN